MVVSFVDLPQSRDLARMHSTIGVQPKIANVVAGHPAVRAIAESGDVIEVTAAPPVQNQPGGSTRPSRPSRPSRSAQSAQSNRTPSSRHRPAPRNQRRPSRSV
jgi:hypothetical protein